MFRPTVDPPGPSAPSASDARHRVSAIDMPANASSGAQGPADMRRNLSPAVSIEHITTVLERLEASFGAYSGTCDQPKCLSAVSPPGQPATAATSPALPGLRGLPSSPTVRSSSFPQPDYAHKTASGRRTLTALSKYPTPLLLPNELNERLILGRDIATASPCSSASISPSYSPLGFHEPVAYDCVNDSSSLGVHAPRQQGIAMVLPPKTTGAVPVGSDLPRASIDTRPWVSAKNVEQFQECWNKNNVNFSVDDGRNHSQDFRHWMQLSPAEMGGEVDMRGDIGASLGDSNTMSEVVRLVGNSSCSPSNGNNCIWCCDKVTFALPFPPASALLHSLGFTGPQEPQNLVACAGFPIRTRQAPSPVPQAFPGYDAQSWQPRSSDSGGFAHRLGQGIGYMPLAKPTVDGVPLIPSPSLVAPWASDYLRQIYPAPNCPGEALVLEVKGADDQRPNPKTVAGRINHLHCQQHLADHGRRANLPVNWTTGSVVPPSMVSSPRPMTPASQSDCSVTSWPRSPPPTQGAPRTRGQIRSQGRRPAGAAVPVGHVPAVPGQVFQIYDDDNLESPFDLVTCAAAKSMSDGSLVRRASGGSDPSGGPRPKPHVDTYLAQVVMNDFCERSEQKSQLKLRYRRRWRALSVILHRGEREVAWPLADVLKVVVNEDAGHIVVTMKPGFRRAYRVNPRGPGAAFMPISADITGGGLDRAAAALLLVAHSAVSKRHLRRLAMILREKGVEVEVHSIVDLATGGPSGIQDAADGQWVRAYMSALIRAVSPEIPAVLADPLHRPNPASLPLAEATRKRQWAMPRLVDLEFALRVLSALPENVSESFWAKTYDGLLRDCSCFDEVVTAEVEKWNRKVDVLHLPDDNKLSVPRQDTARQDGNETAEGECLDFADAASSVAALTYEGDEAVGFRTPGTGGSPADVRGISADGAEARCRTHLLLTWLSHLRFALVAISRVEPMILEQIWTELYEADTKPRV